MTAVTRTTCALLLPLLLALCLPDSAAATCSAGTMVGQADSNATHSDSEEASAAEPALSPPTSRTPAASARSESSPAPRARWHRYLPGMFK
jgi:hypothetical protein